MKKIWLLIYLTSLLFNVAALSNSLPSSPSVYTLDDLTTNKSSFPSCNNSDYYWYQQSGPDSVKMVQVESSALILQADSVVGQRNGEAVARGHVNAYKNYQTVDSDWLLYNESTAHATAYGHVILTRQYDVLTGKWIDYYIDLNRGIIQQATVHDNQSSIYASGSQIDVLNRKQLQIESSYFTSCDPKHPSWHIAANSADFDYQNGQGNARGTTFYAESTPILSFPYLQFPLGQRQSGFLPPDFGEYTTGLGANGSYGSGGFFGIPYYWDMAPNYDMTIEPKYFSGDGFMITDDFRYKTQDGMGELYTEQLPDDSQTGTSRYYYHFLDTHTLFSNLTVGYEYNDVSDNNYFLNFGNFISTVNNINLNREAYVNYTPQWGNADIKVQGYQTLQPIGQPPTVPIYSVLPQIDFNVKPHALGNSGLDLSLQSQYTNFSNAILSDNVGAASLQEGARTVIYPSLTYPLQSAWGFVKPKFGYSYTNYSLDPFAGPPVNNDLDIDRTVPITSLDSGLIFTRDLNLGDSSYSQTLEPRLYYLYIPEVNQSNIPVFDTAQATYNLDQLFSENRFAGFDRINMANDLTMGVSSKLIDDNTGIDNADWGLGYRYYITPEDDTLYGNPTADPELFLPEPNLIAQLNNKWTNDLSSNLSYQYSTVYDEIDAYTIQTTYNPAPYEVLNARFTYQYQLPLLYQAFIPGQVFEAVAYENQYALDLSGQWPLIGDRWLIDARTNYDFTYGELLNFVTGIEYNAGCWAVSTEFEDYVINVNQQITGFFVNFSLKGLADNIGGANDLSANIPGYAPITNMNHYMPY